MNVYLITADKYRLLSFRLMGITGEHIESPSGALERAEELIDNKKVNVLYIDKALADRNIGEFNSFRKKKNVVICYLPDGDTGHLDIIDDQLRDALAMKVKNGK